jgi:serine/threonine protein kinase
MSNALHCLAPGTRIDCFEIGQVLGIGGFGITYKGYDHTLSCDVAIKEYLPSSVALRTGDGITVAPKSDQDQDVYSYGLNRFLDEARILARFKAPSIIRVSRFLEGNGTAYLIMDYEDGEPLDSYLKRNRVLDEQRLISILVPILNGLRDVHAQGYFHRDIKPGNIYLRRNGSPVLLDFGSARQSMEGQTTGVTAMVTPGYAPIEQYNINGKQGPWTDIYGMGATLYRCITGANPAGGPERMMALQAGETDPLTPAAVASEGKFADELLAIVDWMLRPNIADRPASVNEILARLPSEDTMPREIGPVHAGGSHAGMASDATTGGNRTTLSSTQWRSAELETLMRDLAAEIGPMAKLMVKEASARTDDLSELYNILADAIPGEEGRQRFLKSAKRSESATTGGSRPRTGDPGPGPTSAPQTGAVQFSDDLLERAVKALTTFVGPMARMLVRKAAQQAADAEQLRELLEGQIDNDSDRERFRKQFRI